MVKIHNKKFPYQVSTYKGFYMMHMDNDLEVVRNTFTSCRESFVTFMRQKYNNPRSKQFLNINTHRLYALITLGASKKKDSEQAWTHLFQNTKRALKLVNSFERHYKWPLSKVRFLDDMRNDMCTPSTLFLGCRKWITSPYLLSAYLLLLRLGMRHLWLKDDIINEPDHKKLVTKLIGASKNLRTTQPDAIHTYCSTNMIGFLMENHTELFSDKPKKYHWERERMNKNSLIYDEGIRKLADGRSGHRELHNKCKTLITKKAK